MPPPTSPSEVASVAVFRGGKLLWIVRRDTGKLTLPGGHLLPGEEPLDGARRELREETGLDPDFLEYLGDGEAGAPDRPLRVHAFRCEDPNGGDPHPALDPDREAAAYEWREPHDCPGDDAAAVPNHRNITLLHLELGAPDGLQKSERPRKEWRARDGLRIPHHQDPARSDWDSAYHDKLVEVFGAGNPDRLRPVRVDITPYLSGTNAVKSQDRHRLYQRMLAGGDRLPPIVVKRSGIGWHVVDGNHRADVALRHGVPQLDAYELLDADHPDLKKALPPDWGQSGVGSDEGRASGFFWPAALHRPTGAIHLNSEGFHGSSCVAGDDCAKLPAEQLQLGWSSTLDQDGKPAWEDGFVLHPKHRAAYPGKVFYTRDEALQFLKDRESRVLAPDWDPYKPGSFGPGSLQSTKGLVQKSDRKLKIDDQSLSPDRPGLEPMQTPDPVAERVDFGLKALQAAITRKKARIAEIAGSSQASAWPSLKGGHRVVVGRDPHNREHWRATGIAADGQPYYHLVGKTYAEALDHAVSMGANIHGDPLKVMKAERDDLLAAATESLDDSLRRPKYQGNPNHLAGHCYVASEALYHLMGGPKSGWVPQVIRHENDTHWYLKHRESGEILDPTAGQFRTPVPYEHGRGSGFLTREPSKRARELISRIESRRALDRRPSGR